MKDFELHRHAGQVPLDVLEFIGVKVLIIDVDNTLTDFHGDLLIPEVVDGLRSQGVADRFVGVGLASNGKSQERVNYIRDLVGEGLGIETYGVCAEVYPKKPDPAMGRAIADHFEVNPNETAVIGDRWVTDVTFGRRLGSRAIALCDKVGEGDAWGVPALRRIEAGIVMLEQVVRTAEDERSMPIIAS